MSETRRRVQPGLYVFRESEMGNFLAGRLDALTEDPSTGKNVAGVRGIAMSQTVTDDVRTALAKKDGFYKAIVQRVATDVWSGGWEPDCSTPELKKEIMAWDANVRVSPMMRGMKEAGRRGTGLGRRDGAGIVLIRLKDTTTDQAQPPAGVAEVAELKPIPKKLVRKVHKETDPAKPRYDQPILYELYRKPGDESNVVKVHWERVLDFIPEPNDDDPGKWEGASVLDPLMIGAEALANIKWAMSEAYYKFGSPILVASVDKEFEVDEESEEVKALDERLGQLKSGAEEKIRVHGATISLLHSSPSDPTPFVQIHREDAATSSGIPLSVLKGDAAGALAGASQDTKRYDQSVITPMREAFATGILLELYSRLQRWGILKSRGQVNGIIWYPFIQADQAEHALMMVQYATAAQGWARVKAPMPKELQANLTFPEESGFDPNQPLEIVQPPAATFGAPGASPGLVADARRDAVAPPDVTAFEERLERALVRAFRAWERQVEAALGAPLPKGDATEGERARAAIEIHFSDEDLARILEAVLLEAAQAGLVRTMRELGEADFIEFIATPAAPVLRQYARAFAAQKAAAASLAVRETVARVLAEGGGLREVQEALRATFRGIENVTAIARTEAMRGYTNGSIAAMKEAGVTRWRFNAYAGACPICEGYDQQDFDIGSGPLPPVHPQDRCFVTAVLEDA